MSYLIKLENINKNYHVGDNNIPALQQIDLQIAQGEMTAIIGASGSGKSTLMNIMGLLDRPTSGTYLFSDKNVSQLTEGEAAVIRNRHIGFVFQSFFLLPRMNALQNVVLPLFYQGLDKAQATERALTMLEKVGVKHLAQHKPLQLSGGQQQRVAIARALVTNPDLILADEPTGALDSETSDEVMDLFVNLHRQEGRTIVIITHDPRVSARSERTIEIIDGKIATPLHAIARRTNHEPANITIPVG